MLEGKNPYAVWLNGWDDRFMVSQGPNCLPHLFYFLLPFAFLDWPTAKCLWMIVNVAMAGFFAWLLYAAQKGGENNGHGLLLALFFLSSNPVRNVIGNGQNSLLILLATLLALSCRSKPLLSGLGLGISMAKYSFGAFFLAAELGRRRLLAGIVALTVVFAGYLGLAIQTRASLNSSLLMGPIKAIKKYPSFADHFLWLHQNLGDAGVAFLPLIGLAIVFFRAYALTLARLPADEVDMKLACGAVFAALLFAPHHLYDFVVLALPLALGYRLANLKAFERYLYGGTLLAYWNLPGPLDASRQPVVAAAKTVLSMLALALLTYVFLAKTSNRMNAAKDRVNYN
jgi:hypothetical protein